MSNLWQFDHNRDRCDAARWLNRFHIKLKNLTITFWPRFKYKVIHLSTYYDTSLCTRRFYYCYNTGVVVHYKSYTRAKIHISNIWIFAGSFFYESYWNIKNNLSLNNFVMFYCSDSIHSTIHQTKIYNWLK